MTRKDRLERIGKDLILNERPRPGKLGLNKARRRIARFKRQEGRK